MIEFILWIVMFIWSQWTVKQLETNDTFLDEWSDKNAKD